MIPKPKHLGMEYAEQFKDSNIAEAYRYRPPYPAEVFSILTDLISDDPRAVLDVGCGTGDIARRLVNHVAKVDAVDFSQPMLEIGKNLPGGDAPGLHWIYGRVEEAPLIPPYALITAGSSLHWMDWSVVLPRFQSMLTPRGYLAIVEQGELSPPWHADLGHIIARYSTNQDYQPYDLVVELKMRGLFEPVGGKQTTAVPFVQPLTDYIEAFHSRNGFSKERMNAEQVTAFDAELHRLVSGFAHEGMIELQVYGQIVWGKPMSLE